MGPLRWRLGVAFRFSRCEWATLHGILPRVKRAATPILDHRVFHATLARVRPQAIAVDLDGTLLDPAGEVSLASRRALSSALEAGLYIVPITARSPRGLENALANTPTSRIAVASLGAIVWDRVEGLVLQSRCLASADAEEIIAKARTTAFRATVAVEIISDLYVDPGFPMASSSAVIVNDLRITDLAHIGAPTKILLCPQDVAELGALAGWLADQFGETASVIPRPGGWVEVLAHRVDKGSGLLAACKHYAISPDRIVAIGDEATDIAMFDLAGVPVAMPLALPRVKSHAVETGISSADFVAAVLMAVVNARRSE